MTGMFKPAALTMPGACGARNPHGHPRPLRLLRSGRARPRFARDGLSKPFLINNQRVH
jgi:hypothetical protein